MASVVGVNIIPLQCLQHVFRQDCHAACAGDLNESQQKVLASRILRQTADAVAPRNLIDTAEAHAQHPPNSASGACSYLPGKDCGVAACVSSGWRRLLAEEVLWRDLCSRDWGIDTPLWPDGIIRTSFRRGCMHRLSNVQS